MHCLLVVSVIDWALIRQESLSDTIFPAQDSDYGHVNKEVVLTAFFPPLSQGDHDYSVPTLCPVGAREQTWAIVFSC